MIFFFPTSGYFITTRCRKRWARRFSELLSVCAFSCLLSFLASSTSFVLTLYCPLIVSLTHFLLLFLIYFHCILHVFSLFSLISLPYLLHPSPFLPPSLYQSPTLPLAHLLFSISLSIFITLVVLMRLDLSKCFEHAILSHLLCFVPWCFILFHAVLHFIL